ncbi:acyltransferase [Mucilaginibacter calamicampi]|uniref:Acyltransferase n=1 Tax=Mucilaginibacter calamicampi TaxID=1302352 RepID=A0ABW2YWA3_9SPHI
MQGKKYISVSDRTVVQRHGWLLALKIDDHDPELTIGSRCAIGDFCHIAAVRKVIIQDKVLIANKVYIADNTHQFTDVNLPVLDQPIQYAKEVVISTGAWIGENVCIMGASVGKNSIVGANSVVTKDIPDYCVAVGSPARIIKKFDFTTNMWQSVS